MVQFDFEQSPLGTIQGVDWAGEVSVMKSRIAVWAAGGALIVGLWSIYLSGSPGTPRGLEAMLLVLSCPVALARQHHLTIGFVLLANALTYALVGLAVEAIRHSTLRPVKQAA